MAKQYSDHNHTFKVVTNLDGVERGFLRASFGGQIDSLRAIQEFQKTAKSFHVDCKRKSSVKQLKIWIKDNKPNRYVAYWREDEWYKSDAVEIFYDAIE